MSDPDDATAEDVFGPPPPPGTTVKHRDVDPCASYRPRPRYRWRADGRAYPLDRRPEPIEKELPDAYCPRPADAGPETDDGVRLHRRRLP
jgi:hypothetical protein